MSNKISGVDRGPNASDDASISHRKLTATDPITAESTNAASGNKAGSEAAAKDNADMSMDIEIGIVSDADEYSIDQSHVDGGADDDLQKVFAGRPFVGSDNRNRTWQQPASMITCSMRPESNSRDI